jgi:hypothetical protein
MISETSGGNRLFAFFYVVNLRRAMVSVLENGLIVETSSLIVRRRCRSVDWLNFNIL